jgi:hypothetical protein
MAIIQNSRVCFSIQNPATAIQDKPASSGTAP